MAAIIRDNDGAGESKPEAPSDPALAESMVNHARHEADFE
jgi:hypothetical protein